MGFNPFLRQVADYYSGLPVDRLARLCFVFPNQRSAYFFTEYFKRSFVATGRNALIMPQTLTFSSLAEAWSGLIEADRTELMLLLYKTYLENFKSSPKPDDEGQGALAPDRFLFWSEVILDDFSDIDLAMADAGHLFRNLKDLKELQTNPLSEEQIQLIRQFWDTTGVPWINEEEERRRMWVLQKHDSSKEGVRNFLKLWEVLGPLYDVFRETLAKAGICYRGMAYKEASERIRKSENLNGFLDKEKYIFAGFSSLSRAEAEIMTTLKKAGAATFHWDLNMPKIGEAHDFPLRLIERYAKAFPMPEDFEVEEPDYSPTIDIYAIPTEIGQVKMSAELLATDKGLTAKDALKYAVVLPETGLCVPLLNSLVLPEGVDANITMGFPLKDTTMSSLMESLASMHISVRLDDGKDDAYFKPAIKSIVSHISLMKASPSGCRNILNLLREERRMHIPASTLAKTAPELAFLFKSFNREEIGEVFEYMIGAATHLHDIFEPIFRNGEEDGTERSNIEFEFLEAYLDQLIEFKRLVDKYSLQPYIKHADTSVMEAIRKMLRRLSVSFAGTPLKGIQIMGILETRALDFETVIITSMNERSFPRKLEKASFLPQTLREAYGLRNRRDEETVMAYHFYRLIGRARHIHLLYNSNTEGLKSGEPSRYIYQLKYLFKCPHMKESALSYASWIRGSRTLEIEKTPEVMEKLRDYISDSGSENKRYLSASSIKRLLSCPLEFYLSSVCRLSDDDEDFSHIDDSMYGTIIHDIMEKVYQRFPRKLFKGKDYPHITPYHIDAILATTSIEEIARRSINKVYLGADDDKLSDELNGESRIFFDIAVKSVRKMLKAEKKYLTDNGYPYFLFLQAEVTESIDWKVDESLTINFVYIIDRVDRMFRSDNPDDSYLRIVDYKTGKDTLEFEGVDSLVDYSSLPKGKKGSDIPKAITQLMLYSIAYALDRKNDVGAEDKIQPLIYRFRDVVQDNGSIHHLKDKSTREDLSDYNAIKGEFTDKINGKLKELFDTATPIRQASDKRACTYCEFKEICARE